MPFIPAIVAIVLAATLTEVAVAVSIIGAGLSIIGGVTHNKTLVTIGTVMGAVGAVGGIGAAMSGIGEMTVGQVASKAASTVGTQAATRAPGAASGIIAEAAKTGTNAAQAGLTDAAQAAASAAPKAIGGPVQNVTAPVTNTTNLVDVLNPKVTNTMDTLADDAANKFLKGMSGQGAMNMNNGSGGMGLTAPQVEQGAFVKNYLNGTVETPKKGILDSIDGTGKLMLATTGGQAVAGLAAGWFQGESASEQLDFQKEMYAEQKKNRSYAPLV